MNCCAKQAEKECKALEVHGGEKTRYYEFLSIDPGLSGVLSHEQNSKTGNGVTFSKTQVENVRISEGM